MPGDPAVHAPQPCGSLDATAAGEMELAPDGQVGSRSRTLSGDRIAQLMKGPSEDSSLCVICLDQKRTMCLIPCGHLILCEACCTPSMSHCPVCRRSVESSMKVFFA